MSELNLLADGEFDILRCRGRCRDRCILRPLRVDTGDHPAGRSVVVMTKQIRKMTCAELLRTWASQRAESEG